MNAQPAHPMKDLRMGTITVDVDRRPTAPSTSSRKLPSPPIRNG